MGLRVTVPIVELVKLLERSIEVFQYIYRNTNTLTLVRYVLYVG